MSVWPVLPLAFLANVSISYLSPPMTVGEWFAQSVDRNFSSHVKGLA